MSRLRHLFLPHHTNNQRAKLLHPTSVSLVIGFFTIFQLLLGKASSSLPDILGYASQIPPSEIIRLTNIERQSHGLNALVLDDQLSKAAAQKGADMFAKDYWAHVSPTGTQPWFFITQSGYSYRYAGENLARDFSDPNSVVNAWMNSPTHKENLLSNRYQDIGVAVIDGQLGGRETTLVVQMFGTKLTAAAPTSSSTFTAKAQEAAPAVKAVATTPVPEPTAAPALTQSEPAINKQSDVVVPSASHQSVTSPFTVTKYVALTLLGLFSLVLLADAVIINQKKIMRWTSKSMAHLIFVGAIVIAAATILRGQIL